VDLWFYRVERTLRSVSKEKYEPPTGPASCLSDSASKDADANGEAFTLAEPKTDMTAFGEVIEGWPGSKSVARAEGNTSNEGGPESPCRTNYESQAGKEMQRQEASPDVSGVGLAHSIQRQGASPDSGEGANRVTQPSQATSAVRKTDKDWPTFLRAIAEKAFTCTTS